MIYRIPHEVTEGMRRENEVHHQALAGLSETHLRQSYPTSEAYYRSYMARAEGIQLREAFRHIPPGARVLDIGAGHGHISIYLASQGYRVAAVEPSPDLCNLLECLGRLYNLPLTIYNGSGESLDQLPEAAFDVCLFNASLHHCDDPVRALGNCHRLLAPEGRLLLLSEPLLRIFLSKEYFARLLAAGKIPGGDYGGNEHTYYYHEYLDMLRQAGFDDVRDFLAHRYTHPESHMQAMAASGASGTSVLIRKVYYHLIASLYRSGFLGRPALYLLKRLSLLQTNFVATRRSAA